jgi:nitrate reductase delta subunit
MREELWKLGGWALDYPDANWRRTISEAIEVFEHASGEFGPLRNAVKALLREDPDVLEAHYVELFDFNPRRSLSLTYHEFSDRRDRGQALLALLQRVRAAGLEPSDRRLVDEIPVMLEYCAEAGDEEVASRVAGVLRRVLTHIPETSPYRRVVEALLTTLPAGEAVGPVPLEDNPEDVPFPLRDPDVEEAVP